MVSLLLSICLCFSFSLFEILFVLVGSLAKSCASVAPVSEGRRQLLFGAHFAARDSGTVCIDPLSTKLLSTHQGFYILPNSTTATSLATLFPPSTHGSPDVQIVIRPAPAPSAIRCRPLSFSSSDRHGRSPYSRYFFFVAKKAEETCCCCCSQAGGTVHFNASGCNIVSFNCDVFPIKFVRFFPLKHLFSRTCFRFDAPQLLAISKRTSWVRGCLPHADSL